MSTAFLELHRQCFAEPERWLPIDNAATVAAISQSVLNARRYEGEITGEQAQAITLDVEPSLAKLRLLDSKLARLDSRQAELDHAIAKVTGDRADVLRAIGEALY